MESFHMLFWAITCVSISTMSNDSEPNKITAKHIIKIKLQGEHNLFLGKDIISMFWFTGKLFESRHSDSVLRCI